MRSNEQEQPEISLVICTRNRCSQLEQCLQSLEKLRFDRLWEVVVVDNGSTDATAACLEQAVQRATLTLVAAHEARPGLSFARNRGISTASGRLIAFTDDDCYPAPDYLARVVACFDQEDISFLGGRTLLYDNRDARICIQEKADREFIEPRTFVGPSLIQGMNFAAERRALVEVGGFDLRLGAGSRFCSAEDTEIMGRMSWAGLRGLYDPGPVVYHHHQRNDPADIDRLVRGYSVGMGAYLLKFTVRKDSRRVYLRSWLARARVGWRTRTLREFKGALRFAAAFAWRRGGIGGRAQWLDQES
jgi:glycosyltransferase involved in cell wall biosynthesis